MLSLFPVNTLAVGTSEVESASSLLCRMAKIHCVTVSEMLRTLFDEYHHEKPLDQGGVDFRNAGSLGSLIRPNRTTQALVDSVNHFLPSSGIENGTFLGLGYCLDRATDLYAPSFRWCPACMWVSRKYGQEGYFKLIWQLKCVKYCDIHDIQLINSCGRCGSKQNTVSFRREAVYCQNKKCGYPIDEFTLKDCIRDAQKEGYSDIAHLIREMQNRDRPFPDDGVYTSIKRLLKWHKVRGESVEFHQVLKRAGIIRFTMPHPINFVTARVVAARLGLPLVDLLSGSVDPATFNLEFVYDCDPVLVKEVKKRRRIEHKKVRKHLDRELIAPGVARSLREVARSAGVSVGYLRHKWPVLLASLVRKRSIYLKEKEIAETKEAMKLVSSALNDPKIPDTKKTRKHLLALLYRSSGLSKNKLRVAINQAFDQYFALEN